jgi:predicted NBD/HSP70 family sugar kinase
VERLLTAATSPEPQAAATRHTLGQAISGVLAAVIALTDPELIIIGGSWGNSPVILETIRRHGAPSQVRPCPGR